MGQATHNKIVSFIWGIADDVLRDLFKRGKYPDVILDFKETPESKIFPNAAFGYWKVTVGAGPPCGRADALHRSA